MPWVMTANHLIGGNAVFLTDEGWKAAIDGATVADHGQLAGLEARAKTEASSVVEPYAIEVDLIDGRVVPVRLRERLRTAGPTVRLDLGYQAAAA